MKDLARGAVYIGIFAVPFIPLIIANSMFFPFITGKNFTFRIIVEIIFAAWVILALYEPRYRPRFSWIIGGFASLLVVMFFANLFGEYPLKSFWSNFERMEGYVTLVHVFLYLLVVGSTLTTDKMWDRFFNTTLFAAVILSLYAFAQLSGNITINQGGWRLDGTLGNSAYMAVYMLFHTFIAALMFVRTKSRNMKYVYGVLVLLFTYLVIQTATRGTILGLTGGSILAVLYIAIFSTGNKNIRKYAAGGLAALVLLTGMFVVFKESDFIQGNPYLQRVANISLDEAKTRFSIWSMAFEGVKERPILGWGQGNYNYVFNTHYKPSLYAQESWFDRVHNIVMDWLIAGGVLGAIAYFSIIIAALYYLVIRPLFKKDESFTVTERGIILGLLAGYFFHNMFVFDNIVSYVYYGTILAFIHSRVGTEMQRVMEYKIDRRVVEQVAAPVVGVVLVVSLYMVNVPGIMAAKGIIKAFQSPTVDEMITAFDEALARGSFGNQEIREQMTRQAQNIFRSPDIPPAQKQEIFKRIEEELLKQIEEKPGDARVHVFISSFYRMTNNLEPAKEQLAIARSLSPNKQQIIFEQALTDLQLGNTDEALEFFKVAYELDTSYNDARTLYGAGAIYANDDELFNSIINTKEKMAHFAQNDIAVQAAYQGQRFDLLREIFEIQIENAPQDPQLRVGLAVTYYESGEVENAINALEKAGDDIPGFKEQADSFIEDLRAGRAPGQPEVTSETVQIEQAQ